MLITGIGYSVQKEYGIALNRIHLAIISSDDCRLLTYSNVYKTKHSHEEDSIPVGWILCAGKPNKFQFQWPPPDVTPKGYHHLGDVTSRGWVSPSDVTSRGGYPRMGG